MGRRRFCWIQGGHQFVAAIVYSKDAGANVEVWLQDEDLSPVLLTTIPKRIDLGWSITGVSGTTQTVGYVRRLGASLAIDDIRNALVNTGLGIPSRESYEVNYTGVLTGGQSPSFSPINGFLSVAGTAFYSFSNGESDEFSQRVRIGLRQTATATVTVINISNYAWVRASKSDAVYVSIRTIPYNDSTPSSGAIFNSLRYWNDGTLTTFSRPNGDTPTGNVSDPQPLNYLGGVEPLLNTIDGINYRYTDGLPDLINGGNTLTGQTISVNGDPATMTIKGVESGATAILAVAVAPA